MANYSAINEIATDLIPAMFDVLGALISGFVTLLLENIVILVIVGAIIGAIGSLVFLVINWIKKAMNNSTQNVRMK